MYGNALARRRSIDMQSPMGRPGRNIDFPMVWCLSSGVGDTSTCAGSIQPGNGSPSDSKAAGFMKSAASQLSRSGDKRPIGSLRSHYAFVRHETM